MAAVFFFLFGLPTFLIGAGLTGLGAYSLWGYLLGGPRRDPFRWPTMQVVVTGHRPVPERRLGRIPVGRAPHVEKVEVLALVRVPTRHGEVIKEVSPKVLCQIPVVQPAGMSFWEFMARAEELAMVKANELLPAGSVVPVNYNPDTLNKPGWVIVNAIDNQAGKGCSVALSLFMLLLGLLILGTMGPAMLSGLMTGAPTR